MYIQFDIHVHVRVHADTNQRSCADTITVAAVQILTGTAVQTLTGAAVQTLRHTVGDADDDGGPQGACLVLQLTDHRQQQLESRLFLLLV